MADMCRSMAEVILVVTPEQLQLPHSPENYPSNEARREFARSQQDWYVSTNTMPCIDLSR